MFSFPFEFSIYERAGRLYKIPFEIALGELTLDDVESSGEGRGGEGAKGRERVTCTISNILIGQA